jgi:hypothetical protein
MDLDAAQSRLDPRSFETRRTLTPPGTRGTNRPIESHFEQMVQRGHRDQLPSNYGVARRVEPEAKFFNDFSRARACARARERRFGLRRTYPNRVFVRLCRETEFLRQRRKAPKPFD